MARITVKAKIDGGTHLKYGEIKAGKEYTIEEEDFGPELFDRPSGFESPHERAEREQREAVNGQGEGIPSAPVSEEGWADLKPVPTPQATIIQEGSE